MQSGEAWRQGLGRGKSWLMPMPVLDGGEGPVRSASAGNAVKYRLRRSTVMQGSSFPVKVAGGNCF